MRESNISFETAFSHVARTAVSFQDFVHTCKIMECKFGNSFWDSDNDNEYPSFWSSGGSCGFTNHYTAVTWFGYDENEEISEGANAMVNQIWANVMKNVHKNLIKADFQRVNGVQAVEICSDSGKIAGDNCKNTYIEYFRSKNVIDEVCSGVH